MEMFVDYFSGVVERCTVDGGSTPECVQNFKIYAGTTNSTSIVTNNARIYTNLNTWVCWDTITRTNVFSPFVYTSTNGLAITTTNKPLLTTEMISAVDASLGSLLYNGRWAQYWRADTSGYFNAYLSTTNIAGEYPSSLPAIDIYTGIQHLGIGYVTNGSLGGMYAHMTFRPSITGGWTLAELRHVTNSWLFYELKTIPENFSITNRPLPVLKYYPAGSNSFSTVTISISGVADGATNQIVTMSSTNDVVLNYSFRSISSMTSSNTPANTGDVFAISYVTNFATYSAASFFQIPPSMPHRFYAEDYFERIKLVNLLRWTIPQHNYWLANATYTHEYWNPEFAGGIHPEHLNYCPVTINCSVGSEITSNVVLNSGEEPIAPIQTFVFAYYENLVVWDDCFGGGLEVLTTQAYYRAYGHWNGSAACDFASSNYSYAANFYCKSNGSLSDWGLSGYQSLETMPPTWTNASAYFSLYHVGASNSSFNGNNYIRASLLNSDFDTSPSLCIDSNNAPSFSFNGFDYSCGEHCSLAGSYPTNLISSTYRYYSIAPFWPSLISVIKYDVPGGFHYITTNAP